MGSTFATYNVRAGGYEGYNPEFLTSDPPRLDDIGDAVNSVNADTISLIDTYGWHQRYRPADLRAIFGYPHVQTDRINDSNIGITILSRPDLIDTTTIDLGERQALGTSIELNDGAQVTLLVAYLHHASEAHRTEQVQALSEYAKQQSSGSKPTRTVLVGDLNTVSRRHKIAHTAGKILRASGLAKGEGMLSELSGVLEGEAYDELLRQGFTDSHESRTATWPSPQFKLGSLALPRAVLRVDYITHTPDIIADRYTVHRDKTFHKASDHYPLSATIAVGIAT